MVFLFKVSEHRTSYFGTLFFQRMLVRCTVASNNLTIHFTKFIIQCYSQSNLHQRRSVRNTPWGTSTWCPGSAGSTLRTPSCRRSGGPHTSSPVNILVVKFCLTKQGRKSRTAISHHLITRRDLEVLHTGYPILTRSVKRGWNDIYTGFFLRSHFVIRVLFICIQ